MSAPIRTPDQRLRVFVSSTLGELAPERAAVREAIERLRLTPVMFELGARPHPPRELYRSYLDQSDVFVGLYWQSYGWVAPDEDHSGLEDEYRLAGERPRLLYLKHPAPEREERLDELIGRFQSDDRASYKRFTDPDELAALVQEDLAVLLSERFEASRAAGAPGRGPDSATTATTATTATIDAGAVVPVPLTPLLGRSEEVGDVVAELRGGTRLVTLTGVGGIGKTRLAIEVARILGAEATLGPVRFVPLTAATDADAALRLVADGLGVRVESRRPADAVSTHLGSRPTLLVLDNLEQIDGMGPALGELLPRCSQTQVLATSRRPLRIRGERVFPVGPLALPDEAAPVRLADLPAVRLFLDRARASAPGLAIDADGVAAVAEIVRRLDGIPLAIELAAARAVVLTPRDLLARLSSDHDVLASATEDLPERQRTLRATLDWSHELLTAEQQQLLARLSVFAGGWTLAAAEQVCADPSSGAVLDGLAALLDASLVVGDDAVAGGPPRFRMLGTVQTYAAEHLVARGEADDYEARHLGWCRSLAEQAQPYLCRPGQREWVARMDAERPNLRRAVAGALRLGDVESVVALAWDVVVLYFVRDAVHEPDSWLRAAASSSEASRLDAVTAAELGSLLALTRIHHGDYEGVHEVLLDALRVFREEDKVFEGAVVLHQLGFVRFALDRDVDGAVAALSEASERFDAIGHDWGVSLAEAMLGSVFAADGDLDRAEACQQRALDRGRAIDSDQQVVQALGQLGLVRLLQERYDEAAQACRRSAPLLREGRLRADTANSLDVLAVVLHGRGDLRAAAAATCTAAAERRRLGIDAWPTLQGFLDRIQRRVRAGLGDDEVGRIADQVADADLFVALDEALDQLPK